MRERGISDTVGFVLVFAIIITSVGFTGLYGVDAIETVRDDAQANTAAVSMRGYASGLDEIREAGVPRRTLELQLEGDTIGVLASSLRVAIGYENGSYRNETLRVRTMVRQSTGETEIVYTAGAMFRQERRGRVVVREPAFRCGTDTAHASIVALEGQLNRTTEGTITLRNDAVERRTIVPAPGTGSGPPVQNLTINTTETRYPLSWEQLFDRQYPAWQGSNGRYTCDGIDRAFVRVTAIEANVG